MRPPAGGRRRLLKGAAGAPTLAGLAAAGLAAAGLGGCAHRHARVDDGADVLSGPGAVPAFPHANPSLPSPGTRWVYAEINGYNGLALGELHVEVVSAAPLVLRHTRANRRSGAGRIAAPAGPVDARYAEPWSILVDPWFVQVLRFAQPVPLLPPTLRPGAALATDTTFTVAGDSGTYRWAQRLRALRHETVATPAGRFDCLVVEREIRFASPDPFSTDRRRRDTRWYAPEVGGWVRREWTGDYIDSGHLDDRLSRRREDWVRLELEAYLPAPVATAPAG
ncbi:MAG: hypothetical protein AB7P21_13130 [Lautropia sp.]